MMMRTTLTLDDDVAALLRREMKRTGKGLKSALNDALREGLARRPAVAPLARFKVEARDLGARPGLDYSNVAELIEIAEGPQAS